MKRFIPESLTPLAWTPFYASLDPADRIAYNRLHGLYFLEQTIYFEQLLGRPLLEHLARTAATEPLRREAREFADEEDNHSSWFRELLREEKPEWYGRTDFHLLGAKRWQRGLTRWLGTKVEVLPALLWLQLMAEERALYFGRQFLKDDDSLDERFRAVQRRHLADEPGHIRRDELFIEALWGQAPPLIRKANARLLRWLLREYFLLPKRSGWRVVEQWLKDSPHLAPRRPEARQAMSGLATDTAFLKSLYPRRHLPRTATLSQAWQELAFLQRFLTD
jgi:hypothetical protein